MYKKGGMDFDSIAEAQEICFLLGIGIEKIKNHRREIELYRNAKACSDFQKIADGRDRKYYRVGIKSFSIKT